MKFFAFEGLDGSGKSTVMGIVAERLKAEGYQVLTIREPGSTILGEKVRDLLLKDPDVRIFPRTEALLFAACRAQLYDEVITVNRDQDVIILCDRFVGSSLAYQGAGKQVGIHTVAEINYYALGAFRPDLTILLAVTEEDRLNRTSRELDKIESRDQDYFLRVRRGYEALAQVEGWNVVDTNKSIEEVANEVYNIIKENL